MVWKKVVRVAAKSACPACGNSTFDFAPGADIDDPQAPVICAKCGYACSSDKFVRPVDDTKTKSN
jgi:ribosomal protein S27AE